MPDSTKNQQPKPGGHFKAKSIQNPTKKVAESTLNRFGMRRAKSSKSSKSLLALSLQLGQQGGDLSRTRGSQGMSQGDGAALGVHLGHQKSWDFHGMIHGNSNFYCPFWYDLADLRI
jgi:hypothetical protein